MLILKPDLQGSILDIGGGGEGIIGRLYGSRVIAINSCQEELDEAPDGFKKMLMDACRLTFPDERFDNTTFFYSLMFMDSETQRRAISESARVLKKGGRLHIWDSEIKSAYPDPFAADLDIQMISERIHVTYEIVSDITDQTSSSIGLICIKQGLAMEEQNTEDGQFHMVFRKSDL